MADAGDLKSLALDGRAGSSPALAIFYRSPEHFLFGAFFITVVDVFLPLFYRVGAEMKASASPLNLPVSSRFAVRNAANR